MLTVVDAIWLHFSNFVVMSSPFYKRIFGLLSILFALSGAQDPSCTPTILTQSVPPAGSGVALESFSYCGGSLSARAYIEVSLSIFDNSKFAVYFLIFAPIVEPC
jgi:hypothetical protein